MYCVKPRSSFHISSHISPPLSYFHFFPRFIFTFPPFFGSFSYFPILFSPSFSSPIALQCKIFSPSALYNHFPFPLFRFIDFLIIFTLVFTLFLLTFIFIDPCVCIYFPLDSSLSYSPLFYFFFSTLLPFLFTIYPPLSSPHIFTFPSEIPVARTQHIWYWCCCLA